MPKPSAGGELDARCEQPEESDAYEAWFLESVQASIDDPRPNVSDADARKEFEKRRAELFGRRHS